MINLVLFGSPGAGKGTQAERLQEKYNLVHISTGDVFRFNIKNKTELGKLAKSYIDEGQLVPDNVTIDMLHSEVERNKDASGFIFDGFPRTTAQAEDLDEVMAQKGSEICAMLALEVDEDALVQRLLDRGKVSGRKDDANEEIIRKRLEVYYEQTDIVKTFYKNLNKYHKIDGVGSVEEITERLSKVIDQFL